MKLQVYSYIVDLAKGAKRLVINIRYLVLQYTNNVGSNPNDAITKMCQLKI